MGLLIDGRWQDQWYDTKSTGGAFKRQESAFRNWITADGSSGFKAEPGRYHLYVSLATAATSTPCTSPSASRTSWAPARWSSR